MTGPLAGEPRERRHDVPTARRVGSWLVWWVLLMSFWVILDDSVAADELLAGAGAGARAVLAELFGHQAATRFRMRTSWLGPALRLPGQVPGHRHRVRRPVAAAGPRRAAAQRVQGDSRPFWHDTLEASPAALLVGGTSFAPNRSSSAWMKTATSWSCTGS